MLSELFQKLKKEFFIIAGPCVIENEHVCFEVAEHIKNICEIYGITYIFKSSFDKANRSSVLSYRGPGIDNGLKVLNNIKKLLGIPVLTDIHETYQIEKVLDVVDIIQIPAFLCRQTDLLIAAGKTGKPVNVKKGQFLSGYDMRNVVSKLESTGNREIILTERGNMFGYNNLVVDMRNFSIMKSFNYPVIFDATHSVQLPGGQGACSGGNREFVIPLASASVAAGASGVFMEVHPEPDKALCDGPNSLHLKDVEKVIKHLLNIFKVTQNRRLQ